ncbi:NADH-quinone oxidoreductase subunit J [Actinopolyspora mortivallis]|uniref:NADH-quinone oxidoreductase subunit J n=1 Tax=Actinopolyspora mortivallis TaxID=33906 RepID=UPI00037639B0|nr:NADH-quinone oxidoreductase subunit J [Actinopolyspora mortivallis]
MQTVLAWGFGVLAVVCALLVFRLDSMARVTFALLASFLFVAFEVLLLGLNYLGVVLVLMTVMEMVIMAVFMVMYMMNPAGLVPMAMYHNRAGAMAVSVGTFCLLAAGTLLVDWPERVGRPVSDPTAELGAELMSSQMPTMMTLGMVLFAAILATVTLSMPRGRYDRFGGSPRGRPTDPVPGGLGPTTVSPGERR